MIHSDAPAWHSQAMRLRLPFLLGALAAAAIAVSPAHGGERRRLHVHQARGCRHDQADLQEAAHRAGQEPAIRDRDDDQLRRDPYRPRPQARRSHPQLDRLPRHEALLRRADIPARRPGLRPAGRRSARRRHGRARLRGRRRTAQVVSLQGSETSRWPRRAARPRALPALSSSSSPAPAACNCPGLRSARPCGRQGLARDDQAHRGARHAGLRQPAGCPPSKKVWITRLGSSPSP